MIRVCAWCRLFLGLTPPHGKWDLTHTICPPCRSRLRQEVAPALDSSAVRTLIVSPHGFALDSRTALELAGSDLPTLVLVDRRRSERCGVEDRRASAPTSWRRGFIWRNPVAVPETVPLAVV
jgi:hypothetical protein